VERVAENGDVTFEEVGDLDGEGAVGMRRVDAADQAAGR
jgi:hypothetical protein